MSKKSYYILVEVNNNHVFYFTADYDNVPTLDELKQTTKLAYKTKTCMPILSIEIIAFIRITKELSVNKKDGEQFYV